MSIKYLLQQSFLLILILGISNKSYATGPVSCSLDQIATDSEEFRGLGGSSDNNVIAVGHNGSFYHYDGTSWSLRPETSDEDLHAVSVISTNLAYAAGHNGRVLRFDGTSWSNFTSTASDEDLNDIEAESDSDIWAVGKKDTLEYWNGSTWTDMSGSSQANVDNNGELRSSWADLANFYTVEKDGDIYHYTKASQTWNKITACNAAFDIDSKSMLGDGGGNIYIAGQDKGTSPKQASIFLYTQATNSCSKVFSTATEDKFEAISGYGSVIYAAGKDGLVVNNSSGSWAETIQGSEDWKAIWVSDSQAPYYAGKNGYINTCSPPAPSADQPEMVAGQVTLNDTYITPEFTHVCFAQPFSETPLVFSLPTDEGSDSDPALLRIRNVTTMGFDIAQVEGSGSDGAHTAQTIDFIAIVPGVYDIDGGAHMEVGSVNTARFRARYISGSSYEDVNYQSAFASNPAIIAAIQTMNNETATPPGTSSIPFLSVSTRNVTTVDFDLALGRMESVNGLITTPEVIGYIAIEGGKTGEINPGISYQSLVSADNIRGNSCRIIALSGFTSQPLVVASKNRHDGGDGGWVGRCSISNTSVGLYIDEDIDNDGERSHTSENAGILALGGTFTNFTSSCPVTGPDHLSISHDGSAINCLTETITISGHDSTHNIDTAYTGTVALSTDTSHGNWSFVSGSGGIAANLINSGSGVGSYSFDGTENGSVTLGLFNTFAEVVNINVSDGTVTETSGSADGVTDDADLEYEAAGFVFDVPLLTACKPSANVTIKAVKQGSNTAQCVSALTGNKTLSFWSDYDIPASGSNQVQINGTNIAASSTGTNINLTFDINGEAQFTSQYNDAGRMNLTANYDDGNGLVMTGSDLFISKPAALVAYSSDNSAACASQDASCSQFKKAGETFDLKVNAACWTNDADTNFTDNPTTPNFELASIGINHAVVAPTGGVNGQLGQNSFNFSTTNAGMHTIQQTLSEVGVFTFDIVAPPYIGETLNTTTSAPIGRFYPDHFETTTASNGSFGNNACTGFSYSGQAFTYLSNPQLLVTAFNANTPATVTQNYKGNFAKLSDTDFSVTAPFTDANQLGADANLVPLDWQAVVPSLTDNNNGSLTFAFGNDNYTYRHELNSQIAPFNNAIDLTFTAITDSDNVTTSTLPHTLQPSGESIRFGRVSLDSGHGSELMPLDIAIRAEYYTGFGWLENSADQCTTLNSNTHVRLANAETAGGSAQVGTTAMTIASGTTSATLSNTSPFSAGSGLITLSAPGEDNLGFVDIFSNIGTTYPWLLDLNNGEAQGRASFGLFKGSDNIIFRRERY